MPSVYISPLINVHRPDFGQDDQCFRPIPIQVLIDNYVPAMHSFPKYAKREVFRNNVKCKIIVAEWGLTEIDWDVLPILDGASDELIGIWKQIMAIGKREVDAHPDVFEITDDIAALAKHLDSMSVKCDVSGCKDMADAVAEITAHLDELGQDKTLFEIQLTKTVDDRKREWVKTDGTSVAEVAPLHV